MGITSTAIVTPTRWATGDKASSVRNTASCWLSPVGGAYSEPAFRSLAWKGRHLVVGFTAGDIPKLPFNLPLLKGASLVGVFLGGFLEREPQAARENARQLIEWLAAGAIRPHVSGSYPLERGVEALREVAERRVRGKVLIVPG